MDSSKRGDPVNVFKFPINNFSPIDEQIYIHLKNIIRNKEFEDIKIFPTPRDLAIQIKQSYSDVMSAYRQLEVEGYQKKQDDIFHDGEYLLILRC